MTVLEEDSIEGKLRQRRQQALDRLQLGRDAAREFEAMDAKIKAEVAKLNQHVDEIEKLKQQRRELERRAPGAVVAEQFLREEPTPWVAARQREIRAEGMEVHAELTKRLESREWIRDRMKYPASSTQEKLERKAYDNRLTILDDEIAKLQAPQVELREESNCLVQRLLTEAWPDEPQEAASGDEF